MTPILQFYPLKFRTIWISDTHLGSRACCAEFLLDFLQKVECEHLYLVGDIIDLWSMQRSMFWPQMHNNIVREILKKGNNGTKITYIPGNHDGFLRDHEGLQFGNISIRRQAFHMTATGRHFLVLHGDEFDSIVACGRLKNLAGVGAYGLLIWINHAVNYFRRKAGRPYWSLATHLKHRIKGASRFMRRFEDAVLSEAKRQNVDGIICGHVHRARIFESEGLLYCNDGDWVESCTALAERYDGKLELIHWADDKHTIEDISLNENGAQPKAA